MGLNNIKINNTTNVKTGVVYDISKATGQSYETLADALDTNGNNVPLEIREGGMSVRFVHTGDDKYLQYRYTSASIADFTNVTNWELDVTKKNLSDDFMGLLSEIKDFTVLDYAITASGIFGTSTNYKHAVIPVNEGEVYYLIGASNLCRWAYATSDAASSGGDIPLVSGTNVVSMLAIEQYYKLIIPSGCSYLLFNALGNYQTRCFKHYDSINDSINDCSDSTPTNGSHKLAESGGVFNELLEIKYAFGDKITAINEIPGLNITPNHYVNYHGLFLPNENNDAITFNVEGKKRVVFTGIKQITELASGWYFCDGDGNYMEGTGHKFDFGATQVELKQYSVDVPDGAVTFSVSRSKLFSPQSYTYLTQIGETVSEVIDKEISKLKGIKFILPAGLEYVNFNTIKLTYVSVFYQDGTYSEPIYVNPQTQEQETLIFERGDSARGVLFINDSNVIESGSSIYNVGAGILLLQWHSVYGFVNGWLQSLLYTPKIERNSLFIRGTKVLDGIGFNSCIIGEGDVFKAAFVKLIAGHKYRINILNPDYPHEIVSGSGRYFYVRPVTNEVYGNFIVSVSVGESLNSHYDFVAPICDYVVVVIKADVGCGVYFRIDDISSTIEYASGASTFERLTHIEPENDGQLNAVKRIRQLTDIDWSPITDLPRRCLTTGHVWFRDIFKANRDYIGIPYGGAHKKASDYGYPQNNFKIGPWISLETFITSVMTKGSALNTESEYDAETGNSVFFATDCSSTVAYALNREQIPTATLPTSQNITNLGPVNHSSQTFDLRALKLGDLLNHPSDHVAMVTDVIKDSNGNVTYIEISEATVLGNDDNMVYGTSIEGRKYGGVCRRLWWNISDFYAKWSVYNVLRYNNIASVPYTPSPYVQIGNETKGNAVRMMGCMPYMGNGFRYRVGYIPSTKLIINTTGYTKLRVKKDGVSWKLDNTQDYYDITNLTEINIGFSAVGEYEAYMCNLDGSIEIQKSYPCKWSVVSEITPL